jgi:hypothetical protein
MLCGLIEANSKALDARGAVADVLSEAILLDVLAQTVLIGWDAAEVGVPYSVEAARLMLADKAVRRAVCCLSEDS